MAKPVPRQLEESQESGRRERGETGTRRAAGKPAAMRPPCFLQEREFRARCQVLLDALLAEGDEAEEREALEAMWEAEWRASAKAARRE